MSEIRMTSPRFGQMGQHKIIDHRGTQIRHATPQDKLPAEKQFVVHPENTLAAFEESMKNGRAIELDVNANGKTYIRNGKRYSYHPIFHDDRINSPFKPINSKYHGKELRYLPTKAIQTARFDRESIIDRAVKRIDKNEHPDAPGSRVYLDESAEATRIPTLDEVFELLQKYPESHIYVELKTLTQGLGEDTKGMEEGVVNMIKDFGVQDQVTVISFNIFSLGKVKQLAEKLKLPLTTAWDLEPGTFTEKAERFGLQLLTGLAKRFKVDALLPAYEETTPEMVKAAHDDNLKVFPWAYGENRDAEIQAIPKLMAMGVDGVITNVPSDAEQLLK